MRILACALFILSQLSLYAQKVWTPVNEEVSIIYKSNGERDIIPDAYSTSALDIDMLKFRLLAAPKKDDTNRWEKAVKVEIPMPDGSFESFAIIESPVMSPVLAKKYPGIKSYKGVSSVDGYKKIRMGFGPEKGFHAAILTREGSVYIDPYFTHPDEHYISYFTKNHVEDLDMVSPVCGVSDQEIFESLESQDEIQVEARGESEPVFKHVYRLAIACTGEWGAQQGSVDVAMERIVSAANRLNIIYENEAAVFFELIDNNDQIIFLDPDNDPYDPFVSVNNTHAGMQILSQNGNILNSVIGAGAYDIGHVVTIRCTDNIGGVAAFGSLCGNNKGSGVSCVGNGAISNGAIGTLAHEVGHQFSCSHSWSNCPGPLSGAFSVGTAFEPGSGATLMSYSGGCNPQGATVNNNIGISLNTFHAANIEQIYNFINNGQGASCGQLVSTDNNCPEVTIPYESGITIPVNTPFELSGEAFDINNDVLTYSWEQFDPGVGFDLGTPSLVGPQFAIVGPPSGDIVRLLPNRQNLLTMNWNNPLEVMPFGNRRYNFRLIARDNHAEAGYAAWDHFAFNSSDQAGPFVITYPNNVINAEVGSELTVTWDVANTDQQPVNCQFVDISMSTDGGVNFNKLVKANTPNDGEAVISIPNEISNLVRLKVKAVDNIFFNITFPNFRIVEPAEPGFFVELGIIQAEVCLPNQLEVPIQGTAFRDFANPVALSVIGGLPDGATYLFGQDTIAPDGSTALIINLTNVDTTGIFDILIQGVSEDADTITQSLNLKLTGTDFSDLHLLSPLQGTIQMGIDTFKWADAKNAEFYNFELATSPNFLPENIVERQDNIKDLKYVLETILEKNSLFYWRVSANNKCAQDGASEIYSYATEALSCEKFFAEDLPRNITQSGAPTIESKTFLPQGGQVSDINIRNVKGLHENMGDLVMSLISPAGTEVILYNRVCFSSQDFNAGFDDASSVAIACPLANNRTFSPEQPLSAFNGEEIMGDWIFRIKDASPGNGGQFQSLEFQICSNKSLDSPILVNNETLDVRRGFGRYLEDIDLLTTDDNNPNSELIYTLVRIPAFGSLSINSADLEVGQQWTQKDIDDVRIKYTNNGDDSDIDGFEFTVIDGEGGWVGITTFNINVSDDGTIITAVDDLENEKDVFTIYPNPTSNLVFIQNKNKESTQSWSGQLIDLTGRTVKEFTLLGRDIYKMDVSDLSKGIYFVRMQNGKQLTSYSLTVVR